MSRLELRDLRKSYGALDVIKGATLDVEEGEFVVFVGPSGCGKSTLLRMIAGLEDISGGRISIGGRPVNDVPARDRGVAMVFQNYALYPHMSVRDNIGFGLRNMGEPKAQIAAKVAQAAEVLQLSPYLDRRPKALSGGQRQRVAIGRAIVREPQVFLFDEPLSNLDAALRVQMRTEISRLHAKLGATMIYVTHDQTEALTMADRIVVLRDGLIEQVGAPLELYDNPANRFVAGFLGAPKMNFLDGRVARVMGAEAEVQIAGGHSLIVAASGLAQGDAVTLGLRPEAMTLAADGPFAGTVDLVEHLGNVTLVHAILEDGETMVAELRDRAVPRIGQPVRFAATGGASGARVHVFDREGRAVSARVPA